MASGGLQEEVLREEAQELGERQVDGGEHRGAHEVEHEEERVGPIDQLANRASTCRAETRGSGACGSGAPEGEPEDAAPAGRWVSRSVSMPLIVAHSPGPGERGPQFIRPALHPFPFRCRAPVHAPRFRTPPAFSPCPPRATSRMLAPSPQIWPWRHRRCFDLQENPLYEWFSGHSARPAARNAWWALALCSQAVHIEDFPAKDRDRWTRQATR